MNVLRSNRVLIIVQSRTRLQRRLLCTDRGSGADKEKRLGDNTNFNKMTETKNTPSNLGSLSATEKERLLKDLSSDSEKLDLKSVEKAFREQRDFDPTNYHYPTPTEKWICVFFRAYSSYDDVPDEMSANTWLRVESYLRVTRYTLLIIVFFFCYLTLHKVVNADLDYAVRYGITHESDEIARRERRREREREYEKRVEELERKGDLEAVEDLKAEVMLHTKRLKPSPVKQQQSGSESE